MRNILLLDAYNPLWRKVLPTMAKLINMLERRLGFSFFLKNWCKSGPKIYLAVWTEGSLTICFPRFQCHFKISSFSPWN